MVSSGRMNPVRSGFFILLLGVITEAASRSASRGPSVSRSSSYSLSPSVSPSSLVPIINPTPQTVLYISIPLGLFSCILVVAIVVQAMSYSRSIRLLSPNVRLIQSGPPVPPLDLNEPIQTIQTIQTIEAIEAIEAIPATAFSITNPMIRVQKTSEEDPVNVAI